MLQPLPVLSIQKTVGGHVLCLVGKWRPEFSNLPELQEITGVEISSFRGEYESSLDFLSALPRLESFESLYSFPFDYSALYEIKRLKHLKFLTLRESSLDLRKFPDLESAVIPWQPHLEGLFECPRLRCLSLFEYRAKKSDALGLLSALEVLRMKDCSVPEVDFLSGLTNIKRLELTYFRRLITLEPLASCIGLEYLKLSACGKASNYECLEHLRGLRGLMIDTDKETENLEFAKALPNLRRFNFALKVRDGDIRRLLNCPVLASAHFADRKHYNITCDELNQILRSTRVPLTQEEDYIFRRLSDRGRWVGPKKTLVPRD